MAADTILSCEPCGTATRMPGTWTSFCFCLEKLVGEGGGMVSLPLTANSETHGSGQGSRGAIAKCT